MPAHRSTSKRTPEIVWRLQFSKRPKGRYYQAVCSGQTRRTITLGFLSTEEAQRAEENLAFWFDVWTRTQKGHLFDMPPAEVTRTLLLPVGNAAAWEEVAESMVQRQMDAGAYGDMKLRDFVSTIWMPIRKTEAAPKTYYNEDVWVWPRVNKVLGDVKVCNLDTVRWTRFLQGQTDLSGKSKSNIQTGYRACLKYAAEVGAIPVVHAFRAIVGSTRTTTEPGVALTPEEVSTLLDSTSTAMQRALLATAFGQGLRPAEVTRVLWEDVDWNAGSILIRGTKTTGSLARVAMTPATHAELEPYWKSLGCPKTGHAFIWKGKPITSWRTMWENALNRSGLSKDSDGNPRRVIPYSARYTFASVAVIAKVPDGAVRSMMRHSTQSRVLETTYQRLRVSQVAEAFVDFPTFTPAKKEPAEPTTKRKAKRKSAA